MINVYFAGKMRCPEKDRFRAIYLEKYFNIITSDSMDDTDPKYWGHVMPQDHGIDWTFDCHEVVDEHVNERIRDADVLVAYLSRNDQYGTIAEIAYASGCGIPSFVFAPPIIDGENEHFGKWNTGEYGSSQHEFLMYKNEFMGDTCSVTDTYWLVLCFPRVLFFRVPSKDAEDEDIDVRKTIVDLFWKFYR